MSREVRPTLLDYQLKRVGVPVVGVASDGRIDYSRLLTESEKETVTHILLKHTPTDLTPDEQQELDIRTALRFLSQVVKLIRKITARKP